MTAKQKQKFLDEVFSGIDLARLSDMTEEEHRYDDFVRRRKISRLDDERLVRAIEACATHLNSFSAWAVVYQVLCQDYSWDSDMAKFERRINGLEFHKNLKMCKDVGKSLNNSQWMKEPIDDWPITKQKSFAQDLRRAIEEELAR